MSPTTPPPASRREATHSGWPSSSDGARKRPVASDWTSRRISGLRSGLLGGCNAGNRLDGHQLEAGAVFTGGSHLEHGIGLDRQRTAQVRPLVEFLVVAQLERTCHAANGATCAVFFQVDFAMEGGGREGAAFHFADRFLDGVDDHLRVELHKYLCAPCGRSSEGMGVALDRLKNGNLGEGSDAGAADFCRVERLEAAWCARASDELQELIAQGVEGQGNGWRGNVHEPLEVAVHLGLDRLQGAAWRTAHWLRQCPLIGLGQDQGMPFRGPCEEVSRTAQHLA